MTVIGVTGSFGTGKTTVAGMFKKLGAVVFDADKIAHEAFLPGSETYKKTLKIFGRGILRSDGEIDRRQLGRIVFTDKSRLERLCGIVHPYVIRKIRRGINGVRRGNSAATVVLDIPLLIEAGLLSLIDKLIVVKTDQRTQIKRCQQRSGLNRKAILARTRAQMPLRGKIRFSDFIIDNTGTKQKTKREVRKVWEEIQQQAVRKKRI